VGNILFGTLNIQALQIDRYTGDCIGDYIDTIYEGGVNGYYNCGLENKKKKKK
jgi:hypothetical protein